VRDVEPEPEPNQFWMAGAGDGHTNFQMVVPESEI